MEHHLLHGGRLAFSRQMPCAIWAVLYLLLTSHASSEGKTSHSFPALLLQRVKSHMCDAILPWLQHAQGIGLEEVAQKQTYVSGPAQRLQSDHPAWPGWGPRGLGDRVSNRFDFPRGSCLCWSPTDLLTLETRAVHTQGRKSTFCLLFAKIYSFDLCLLMQLAQYLFVKVKSLLRFQMLWDKTLWRMTSICTSRAYYCGRVRKVHVHAACSPERLLFFLTNLLRDTMS